MPDSKLGAERIFRHRRRGMSVRGRDGGLRLASGAFLGRERRVSHHGI